MHSFRYPIALVKARQDVKLRAAVLDDVRKMIGAAAQEKLASMRYTKHLIKAATAAVISLVQSLTQVCFRNDTVHNSNAGASSD